MIAHNDDLHLFFAWPTPTPIFYEVQDLEKINTFLKVFLSKIPFHIWKTINFHYEKLSIELEEFPTFKIFQNSIFPKTLVTNYESFFFFFSVIFYMETIEF